MTPGSHDAADEAQQALDYYDASLKQIRAPSGKGDFPSVAWYSLLTAADRWRVSDAVIAARLVAANVPSDSNSVDLDPIQQWLRMIAKARARLRKKGQKRRTE